MSHVKCLACFSMSRKKRGGLKNEQKISKLEASIFVMIIISNVHRTTSENVHDKFVNKINRTRTGDKTPRFITEKRFKAGGC